MSALLLATALVQVSVLAGPDATGGHATTYWPGDGQSGPRVGCYGYARRVLGTARFARLVARGVPIVAHRDLPCGTPVLLATRHGAALAVVADRGPYGQDCPAGYHVGVRLGSGCRWRGAWDLTPAVAQQIGLRGRGRWRRGQVAARAFVSHTPSRAR